MTVSDNKLKILKKLWIDLLDKDNNDKKIIFGRRGSAWNAFNIEKMNTFNNARIKKIKIYEWQFTISVSSMEDSKYINTKYKEIMKIILKWEDECLSKLKKVRS